MPAHINYAARTFIRAAALLFVVALCRADGRAQIGAPAPFLHPAMNRTHVAFAYAGDIWAVARAGGEARRLTTDAAREDYPVFSPDGSRLAFGRQSASGGAPGWDVYVMPAAGGEAVRLTYHPEIDVPVGWTPDGRRVLFTSFRDRTYVLEGRLYTVPAQGGFPEALPLPVGWSGAFSPDGARLAYVPYISPLEGFDWRNYRGGGPARIFVARLSDSATEAVPRADSNDTCPMWAGDKIYFLSDRDGTNNLFAYDTRTRAVAQLTRFVKFDIKAASFGGGAVVFTQGGAIHVFDPATNETRRLDVRISANDFPETAPRKVNPWQWASAIGVSPAGDRLLFGARGEVFVASAEDGGLTNVTNSPAAAETSPAWSPDGRRIAYFSDESGAQELVIRSPDGGPPRRVSVEGQPTMYSELLWSPDGRRVAFSDAHLNLRLCDLERDACERIDAHTHSDGTTFFQPAWSADGRWLAYSKYGVNRVRSVALYSVERRQSFVVTDPRTDAQWPVFDRGGKYLYFVGSNQTGLVESQGWSGFPFRSQVARAVYAVVLDRETPSPLSPRAARDGAKDAAQNPATATTTPPPQALTVDLAEINRRVLPLAIGVSNPARLMAGKPGALFVVEGATLHKFTAGKPAAEKFVEGAGNYRVTSDGARLLYRRQGQWASVGTDAAPKPEEGRFTLKPAELEIDPRAEWRLLYAEAWRRLRVYFYDPNMHGQDTAALERHYAAYLPNVSTREDLNHVFREMTSHLSSSHMAVGGGDRPAQQGGAAETAGLLGADYEIAQGRYRFKHILRGDNLLGLQAPLAQAGMNVSDGDYLIAVDGEELRAGEDIDRRLLNKAGKSVELKISARADGALARTISAVPVASERALRLQDRVDQNRRRVAELSGGRLAYIYLPGTLDDSFNTFNREFYAQLDKQGLVLDARFNEGGRAADYAVEALSRGPLYRAQLRAGGDIQMPVGVIDGPKVLLTNEMSGSGGDTLPWMAQRTRAATVVGTRTAGAGIGATSHDLLDGGSIRVPDWGWYDPRTGTWLVENRGVTPDVVVENSPAEWRAGRDAQLERAVLIALDAIRGRPPAPPKRPRFPVFK